MYNIIELIMFCVEETLKPKECEECGYVWPKMWYTDA